ncbi:rhodanese-like domain-containing protein 4, chloroplastic [Cucurbita moschata]|uniref:Rhodanese-like domain-containing protein 4, chloroplastic n=3 Tax=Cucurbita TaxID=3660 RepID=A0A6J1E8N1_CUCMO|nr:rhodanese-like domain-containing protein 4, chloroplastic [Cucurbita moschata]
MEALNAASLSPLAVLSDRKREPRKLSPIPSPSSFKSPNSASSSTNLPVPQGICSSRSLQGSLVLLSSVLNAGVAGALTYEEALQQSVSTSSSGDFDLNGVLDGIINFGTENPGIVVGGAVILALPLFFSLFPRKSKPWGVESARNAYAKLGEDAYAQLLDIRSPVELRKVGGPDVRGLGKKPVSITYNGEDKPGFLKKLGLKFKEPQNTTLFILDKYDGNSELVAELVTVNGFKAAFAIKDGAEGPRGWTNSDLPWITPKSSFSLSSLTDAIAGAFGEDSEGLPAVATAVAAAVTGAGVLAFAEMETVLQLLGSAAIIQFVSKKLLSAEDRKKTFQEVDEFLNTKVAPQDLVDDLKDIGKALLPLPATGKSLPAAEEAAVEAATSSDTLQTAEAAPVLTSEPKAEAVAEPAPELTSVAKQEVKAESLPKISRPLSPYPYYPDFRPPTSPTPSQP